MKANETKVEDFLSSNKTQFVIPVYQRNYDWSEKQCKQLFEDLLLVGSSNKINAHFIGSIVYIHDNIYTSSRVKELSIIDGQQRLTTLTLIYLALLRIAKELNDDELVNEILETYLINKFAPEEEKLKLRPTENNDKALKYLIRDDVNEEFSEYSKLIDNFNFFKKKISNDNYNIILSGLSKLMFVEISLDREKDDPQRIFESLNSTGLALSQGDLIRNYILMGLNRENQKIIYQKIEVREVSKLYCEVFQKLFELQPETFFSTDVGLKIGLTNNPTNGNPRQPMAINDTYFIESNLDNNNKFEKLKYALKVFNLEDELIIKYTES